MSLAHSLRSADSTVGLNAPVAQPATQALMQKAAHVRERAREVSSRLRECNDALLGAQPCAEGGYEKKPQSAGCIYIASDLLDDALVALFELDNEVKRLAGEIA